MGPMPLFDLGKGGVDIDTNPMELDPTTLLSSQNAAYDQGAGRGLMNRPGFNSLNDVAAAGSVLGGIGVPFLNESTSGLHFLFLGRGPTV